jgi:hypothetical protein
MDMKDESHKVCAFSSKRTVHFFLFTPVAPYTTPFAQGPLRSLALPQKGDTSRSWKKRLATIVKPVS